MKLPHQLWEQHLQEFTVKTILGNLLPSLSKGNSASQLGPCFPPHPKCIFLNLKLRELPGVIIPEALWQWHCQGREQSPSGLQTGPSGSRTRIRSGLPSAAPQSCSIKPFVHGTETQTQPELGRDPPAQPLAFQPLTVQTRQIPFSSGVLRSAAPPSQRGRAHRSLTAGPCHRSPAPFVMERMGSSRPLTWDPTQSSACISICIPACSCKLRYLHQACPTTPGRG